jgi:hypothetical protein
MFAPEVATEQFPALGRNISLEIIRKGLGGECGRNFMYSCMEMEKWHLLKWGKGDRGE